MSVLVEFVVAGGATVTATAATAGAEWARRASARSARSERLLVGETEDDEGLLQVAHDNRDALIRGDLYPPRATDGGQQGGSDE